MKGSIIRIGQIIKIPGASGSAYVSEKGTKGVRNTSSSAKAISKSTTRYKVKKGDTLQKIANRYSIQVSTLMVANNKNNASNLKAGEILQIPQSGAVLLSSNEHSESIRGCLTGKRLTMVPGPEIYSSEIITIEDKTIPITNKKYAKIIINILIAPKFCTTLSMVNPTL